MIETKRRHRPQGLFGAVLTVSVVGTGVLGGVVAAYVRDLPPLDILEDYEPSLITTLYDDQGRPSSPWSTVVSMSTSASTLSASSVPCGPTSNASAGPRGGVRSPNNWPRSSSSPRRSVCPGR